MNAKSVHRMIGSGVAVLLTGLLFAHHACADPLDQWTKRNSGVSTLLAVVAFANNQFVAVGLSGTVLTSPDGTTWTRRSPGTPRNIYAVAYGGNQWVAVGPGGLVLTSPDAIRWTLRNSGTSADLYYLAYGNGRFVAVGGVMLMSTNGTQWTATPNTTSGTISGTMFDGITFANGKFLAVGQGYGIWLPQLSGLLSTSSDGVNWTAPTMPSTFSMVNIRWGNGLFVATDAAGQILTSPDALNWTTRQWATFSSLNGLAYGEGVFVVAGQSGNILTSSDGITWTPRSSGTANTLYEVAHGSDNFVTVGDAGLILQSGTFIHAAAPSVTTLPASDPTWAGATLNGSADPNGSPTSAWFEYGLTSAYGDTTAVTSLGTGTNLISLSVPLSGLSPATNYHFHIVATNSAGTTSGSDALFSTLLGPGLNISFQSNLVALSWPQSASNFVLETSDLLSPPGWTPVPTNAPILDGNCQVTLPRTGSNQFYRLHQP